MPGLRAQFGDDLATTVAVVGDLYDVTIRGASAEILANELAGWGRDIEVLRPAAVRRCLARIGAELVELYGVVGAPR